MTFCFLFNGPETVTFDPGIARRGKLDKLDLYAEGTFYIKSISDNT